MYDWNIHDAVYQIGLSRQQKNKLLKWWNAADQYFNNTILDSRGYDPEYLLKSTSRKRWGIDNLIPDAVRAFAAWVINSSFDVLVEALGDKTDEARFIAARVLQEQIEFYRNQPQFKQMIREIAIRTKLFNIVGQIDGWDDKRDEPYSRLVTHNDIFIDSTAWGNVNEPNGPRWIAVKYMLSPDEVIGRYGSLRDLQPGLLSHSGADKPSSGGEVYDAFHNMYEIIEWFGIDETELAVSEDEMQEIVLGELEALRAGTFAGPDENVDHQAAIDYGALVLVSSLEEQFKVELETVQDALRFLAESGYGTLADQYMQWQMSHQQFLDAGDAGGTRSKYPGYVYHVDFQIGMDEPLLGPEVMDYPHYQLPVSIYRGHMNTGGLFGMGAMAEVMSLQQDLEWWHKCMMDHAHYAARPPFLVDLDILDTKYRTADGLKKLVKNLEYGHKIFWLRGAKNGLEPRFAMIGAFSWDVMRIIEYIRLRIQEVIGPTPVLRGQVSGEASGKHIQIRQEAAAKPITDTLSMIEGPLQKHLERTVLNILEFSPIEKIEQISGQEGAMAIQYVRDYLDDFRCAVKVDLGTGMPTDWFTKANLGMSLLESGLGDPKLIGEWLKLPIPLSMPQMPVKAPTGANQNQPIPSVVGA